VHLNQGAWPRTGFDPRAHGSHSADDLVDKVVTVPGDGKVATEATPPGAPATS
jgi:hypothetical protein